MTVVVVIPALDEESTIVGVIEAVSHIGSVVVVDDGSSDSTAAVAREAGAHVVRHAERRGYDEALASGIRAGVAMAATTIATVDADGEQVLEAFAESVSLVEGGGAVVAIGTRPAPARVSERIFSLYTRLRFGVPDVLCGVKVYRASFVADNDKVLNRRTIGTGLALAALRRHESVVTFDVPVRPQRPSRFGRGLAPNVAIGKALMFALRLDLSSTLSRSS